jgi:diaphanous 1
VFRFCVPDEWYRRSKSRSVSTESPTPSEETIKRLADLEEQELSDEEDGTAKQKDLVNSPPTSSSPSKSASGDWKGSFSQNRLSSLFESWLAPPSHQTDSTSRDRMSVSEPTLLDQAAVDPKREVVSDNSSDENDDLVDFNQMLVSLGFITWGICIC